ncbi:hypothetical protein OFO01_04635 [Campylobacter sp. JMF_01 NE2]|uniref:DUF6984 family protein n=1 Tax=unclassified Campylobacter TaxID=2593542 RepID=UPI0022E9B7A0|nr:MULTISPECIES: hypothetical protein [unclassified Campylobacter]MDA3052737.1 hypothetical protein [Campylobacter sp. JMF_03 NE3]MDA3067068.1 hypothetical protein [Campylobacter sp. JMF_01 NE2]
MKEIYVYNKKLKVSHITTEIRQMVDILIKNSFDENRKKYYKFSDEIFYFEDGSMGSFGFVYDSNKYIGGGKHISNIDFYDIDGTLCVATMFVYDNNLIDSVDIWKVDFSPLIKIPTNENEFFLPQGE